MEDDNRTNEQLAHELTELRSENAALKKLISGNISTALVAEEAGRYAESIVATVRGPLLVLDKDLKIISANPNFYKAFKVNPAETIGSYIYDLGNKQWDIPKLRELLENILPEKEAFEDFEVDHYFRDIGQKVMLLNARRIERKHLGAKLILLAIEDITARTLLERALAESEERFRRVFETASDGMVLLEKSEGRITNANQATEKMLGYTKEESIGNRLSDIGIRLDDDFQTTMQKLNKNGIFFYDDVDITSKSGQKIDADIHLADRASLVQCNIRDTTLRKKAAKRGVLARKVLDILNRSEKATDTIKQILSLIKKGTDIEAVGIRLRQGEDFPYYETQGFPDIFVRMERYLCARDKTGEIVRDLAGAPVLECMCGNILKGRTDPALPFFTEGGSFWTNCTTDLLASTTEKDLQAHTRNRCNGAGYESVALIPLRVGEEIIGLLQLNDHRKNIFTLEMISFYEGLGASIGISVSRIKAEEERNKILMWQQGVCHVQRSLIAPAPLLNKLKDFTDSIVRIFDADFCRIWLIRPGDLCERGCVHAEVKEGLHFCSYRDRCLHLLASSGRYTHLDGKTHCRVPYGAYKIGNIASGKDRKFLTNDVPNDPRVHNHEWARELGLVSFTGYQLRIPGGDILGVLAIFAKHPILTSEDFLLDGLSSALAQTIQQAYADEMLGESEKKHRLLFESAGDAIFIHDKKARMLAINPAACKQLGYTKEELMSMTIGQVDSLENAAQAPARIALLMERGYLSFETEHLRKDGAPIPVEVNSRAITWNGHPAIMSTCRDISERKRAEEAKEKLQTQLNQAQKMESVGRLAGGVAHDFNNMLLVILGHAEMALMQLDPAQPLFGDLTEIRKAAKRSADLTRQLLAFARKQTIAPQVLDLNEIVESMLKMLRRMIGEDISLTWLPNLDIWSVFMDPSQLDQIMANLCVNARDAIEGVGKITIETGQATFDEGHCSSESGIIPGEFAMLSVSDSGCGMSKETLVNIFEPFFTTKEAGKGTGLGLATVYGIVKQNKGFISVYSEPGQGTAFKIYLPRHRGEDGRYRKVETAEPIPHGNETILLVEDEPTILNITKMMLKKQGYNVLAASTPDMAISLAKEHAGDIHLLMTDVIMPEMNGQDLSNHLMSVYPRLKRLFMSGYTSDIIAHHGVLDEGVHFLQKPFSIKDLSDKVREALNKK